MRFVPHSLSLRPRLLIALAAGAVLTLLLPGEWRWTCLLYTSRCV